MENNKNAGVTTIVVVCAMAIIMALSLGLFLTASVLIKTAQQTGAREQSRILAVSFSREVEKQLTLAANTYESRTLEEAAKVQDIHQLSLWHYVKQNISDGSWPYYEEPGEALHSKENAIRTFDMDAAGVASEIADVQLSMYWIREENSEKPKNLVIKTRVTVKEQTCIITDTYELQTAGDNYEAWTWKHMDKR